MSRDYLKASYTGRASQNSKYGRTAGRRGHTAISWSSFMNGHNNAPEKPISGLMTYPALGGKMNVES